MSSSPSPTLAEWVAAGWTLNLYCGACRSPRAMLSGEQIMERFAGKLLSTVDDVCARMTCGDCGHRGGWHMASPGVDPFVLEGGRDADLTLWLARDLYLRRMLHRYGEPLEIADVVWEAARAWADGDLGWKPRRPATEDYPLSVGARLTLP